MFPISMVSPDCCGRTVVVVVLVEDVVEVDVEEVVVTPGQYKPRAESYQVGKRAQNAVRV